MPARKKTLTSVATLVLLLGFALPAAAATWTTEPVPAGPGALGPARLSFDAQGRALFLWNGVPTASQPRFTGMASRAPGGGWTRLANLPDVGWGNAQALQYATHARAVRQRPGRLRRRVQPGEAAPRRRLRPLGRQRPGKLADARALRDGVRRGGQPLGSRDRALRRRRQRAVDDRAALGRDVRQGDEGLLARRVLAGRRDQRARRPHRRVDPVRAHRGARPPRGPGLGLGAQRREGSRRGEHLAAGGGDRRAAASCWRGTPPTSARADRRG